jgi:hypothetical protein
MTQDSQSEFDRIFGKTQKGNDTKSPEGTATPGSTQRSPSDSDLLGIRTDSDRFILKNIPKTLPEPARTAPSAGEQQQRPENSIQDAMTIALNVNVFANITDVKKQANGAAADGATFVIPLPKDLGKHVDSSIKGTATPASGSSMADEFTRILNPKHILDGPNSNTEFTRVLHIEESVKMPKPNFTQSLDDSPPNSAVPITSAPKLSTSSPVATVVTQPGPSDFTKVIKGSELRTVKEKLAAAKAHPLQSDPSAMVPQYVPAPEEQRAGAGRSPTVQSAQQQPSKLAQYMPVIIVLNLLILMAVLLIVFFAIKK